MKQLPGSFDLAAFFAGGMITVWLASGRLWSTSVDIAHHYALVKAIIDHFPFRGAPLANLNEMNFYPALSHFAAALVSPLFRSGMMAMVAVGVVAIFVTYAALLTILCRVSRSGAVVAALAITVLAVLQWPVHGFELRGNYFYSQIFGQALAYTTLAWAALTWRESLIVDAVVLVAAVFVGYAHLIPALQLLGAYGFLLLTFAVRDRQYRIRVAVWTVACAAYLALHPGVAAMMKIGEHEGGLDLLAAEGVGRQAALLAATGIVGLWALVASIRSGERALRVLASLLIATVALSLGMIAAHSIVGVGSVYGFKKTLFSACTLTPAVFCVLVVRKIPAIDSLPSSVIASVSAVVLTFVSLGRPALDANRLELLRSAVADTGYQFAPNKPVAIVEFPELAPTFNYMLTIATLSVPRDKRGMSVVFNDFTGVDGIQWVLGDPVKGCQSEKVGAIYRTDFSCWLNHRP